MVSNWSKAILAGVVVLALGSGLTACSSGSASGGILITTPTPLTSPTPVSPAATPTTARILVHVAGAVREPGVYALAPDDRVVDAVEAAGGVTAAADMDQVNLADYLQDAMRLYIPSQGAATPVAPTPIPAPLSVGSKSGGLNIQTSGLININTASQAELEALPHIGEALAGRIIAYREANGPFGSIEDIVNVAGIGDKTFADLRNLITVE